MSASWIQGGQPGIRPTQRSANPPPTCFNCGITGHFVVDCPESQQRQTPASFQPLPTNPYQQYPAPQAAWAPQPVVPQNQYTPYHPVHYSQYVPQPPVVQQSYIQPQQPHSAQAPNQQYGRPSYQAPTPQFQGLPQIGSQGYPVQQNYGPQAVAPYQQPPQNNYTQHPPYGGVSQVAPHTFPDHNPTPQWNPPQPTPQQNFQGPQRSNSVAQNPYFRAPSQQSNHSLPRQQSFDHGSKGSFQGQQIRTPVTPALSHNAVPQFSMQGLHQSPVKPESIANSITSTLNASVESTIVVEMPKSVPGAASKVPEKQQAEDDEQGEKPEEGEFGPEDEAEELFQWDYEHAFEEITAKETVALAQPLSASFKSTPVPLIQTWSTKVPSISRYARKDNVIEYVRTIRSSPQWSYLQEDPAFTDNDFEGALIPFDDVPVWTTARHQLMSMDENDLDLESSRKRSRDEDGGDYVEGEVEYQPSETSLETVDVGIDAPPNKRQKQNASGGLDDEVMEEARGTTPGSMIVIQNARGGTPCLVNNLHDAWAPEPGERATSPPDPTEQLLASLGVSGDAKPVQQQELPPYTGGGDDVSSRHTSQTPASIRLIQANPAQQHALPPNRNYPSAQGTPSDHNQHMSNAPPSTSMHGNQDHLPFNGGNGHNMNGPINGPPMNNYSNGPSHGYPNGTPVNGPQMSGPQMSGPQTNVHQMNAPVTSAPPVQNPPMSGQPMTGFPNRHVQVKGTSLNAPDMNNGYIAPTVASNQYGPPVNVGYGNVPPVQQPNYQNAPLQNDSYQPNPHYGQPANNTYGTGAPAQGPYVQSGYGPPLNTQYANGPPNNYSQGNPQGPQGPSHGPQYAQNHASAHVAPANTPQGFNQFGQSTPYTAGPQPNGQYPQSQYGPPANQTYGNEPAMNHQPAPQYGAPQPQAQPYINAPQAHNAYGATTQMSPAQYGPAQVPQYQGNGGYQAQSYQNGPTPQYNNGPPANFQPLTGPPNQMPFNNAPPNNVPQRQDSGYYSAGGSYSNGPASNEYQNQNGMPTNQQQAPQLQQAPIGFTGQNGQPQNNQNAQHGFNNENAPQQQHGFLQGTNGGDQSGMGPSPQVNHEPTQLSDQLALQDITNVKSELNILANGENKKIKKPHDSDATLTDLERELLGELEPAPTRRNPARKTAIKKPQPVVEAAYGRRW